MSTFYMQANCQAGALSYMVHLMSTESIAYSAYIWAYKLSFNENPTPSLINLIQQKYASFIFTDLIISIQK